MAACGIGASGFKLTNLNLGSTKPKLCVLHGLRTEKLIQCDKLVLTTKSRKTFGCRCSTAEAESATSSHESGNSSRKTVSSETPSPLIPNSFEVESLLTDICDTTSIAEVDLKLGGFRLYVKRDLTGQSTTSPPAISNPTTIAAIPSSVEVADLNGSVSSPSLAITNYSPPSDGIQIFLDKAADEGLVIINAPRVGYFRTSRTIKKRRAPPACKEKDQVNAGKVVCYIEQLNCELPVESTVAGEVIKILLEDGDPVGYGDPLIAILPSFPGIKKLR